MCTCVMMQGTQQVMGRASVDWVARACECLLVVRVCLCVCVCDECTGILYNAYCGPAVGWHAFIHSNTHISDQTWSLQHALSSSQALSRERSGHMQDVVSQYRCHRF